MQRCEESRSINSIRIKTVGLIVMNGDVVAVQIVDPHEEVLPALGRITLEDAETGEVGEINLRNAEDLAVFHRHRVVEQEQLQKQFLGMSIDHLRLRTNEPYLPAITKFFRTRLERQRR